MANLRPRDGSLRIGIFYSRVRGTRDPGRDLLASHSTGDAPICSEPRDDACNIDRPRVHLRHFFQRHRSKICLFSAALHAFYDHPASVLSHHVHSISLEISCIPFSDDLRCATRAECCRISRPSPEAMAIDWIVLLVVSAVFFVIASTKARWREV